MLGVVVWLRKWGAWLGGAVLGVVTLGLLRPARKASKDGAELDLERLRTDVEVAGAIRKVLLDNANRTAHLAEQKAEAAERARQEAERRKRRIEELSNAQVAEEFRKLQKARRAARRRGPPVVLLLVLASLPLSGQAQDVFAMPHPDSGVPGIWLPEDLAREALVAIQTSAERDEQVALLREGLRLRVVEAEQLWVAVEQAEGTSRRLALIADLERSRADHAEARADAWWRSPWLWLAVGAVTGIAGSVGVVAVRGGP